MTVPSVPLAQTTFALTALKPRKPAEVETAIFCQECFWFCAEREAPIEPASKAEIAASTTSTTSTSATLFRIGALNHGAGWGAQR
jgi:hypothetical protein